MALVTMVMATKVMTTMAMVMELTDSRPCSVPYGSGSVFNSTVRPELGEMNFLFFIFYF